MHMYHILIAEDEQVERTLVRFLLTREFSYVFQLHEAANGKEALEIMKTQKIHILLTDVQMPFISGIDLAKAARELEPDLEILFFSGFDDFEYVQNALLLHAVNYILKPVNPENFCQTITNILERLNSKEIVYAKSKSYYNDSFFDDNPESASKCSTEEFPLRKEEDTGSLPQMLEKISSAVSLGKADLLISLTEDLLLECSDCTAHSPTWVRYTCVSLLQLFMEAIPGQSRCDFEDNADQIYSLRYFTDIRKIVRKYLHLLADRLRQESDGANYAVYQIKQYIHAHYSEDLTLNLLADYVYLSPNYVSTIFTKVTGLSLHRYIKQFRMKKARELLESGNMKVSEISRAVGYPTASYFIKTFQEMYGVTPNSYRANLSILPSTGKEGDEHQQ